jgi:SulP family sulfate permease
LKRYVDELTGALRSQLALAYRAKDLVAHGLRARLREGYTARDARSDLRAAVAVGLVALPLALALALAAAVPPQHGVYAAVVAGLIAPLLGGARFQITGPTAAFAVILVPIVNEYGLAGALLAGALAGAILVVLGLARLGRLVEFVPHPVIAGLAMAIAVLVIVYQLGNFAGIDARGGGIVDHVQAVWDARAAASGWDVAIAVIALSVALVLPRVFPRVPAPLVAIAAVTVLVVIGEHAISNFHVATIGSRYHMAIGGQTVAGIAPLPPLPIVPWRAGEHALAFDYHTIRVLLPSALAIALLGAIESLATAVASDGMTGTRHEPNAELIALGIANIAAPFFGGIAAAGAIGRTAANIRAGARSPLAGALHAIVVLACVLALAPLIAHVPIAGLAALLVVIALNIAEARHFVRLLRIAPRGDVVVMLACSVLAVAFDLAIAVTIGVVLAALLFMRRMAVLTKTSLEAPLGTDAIVPPGVRLYEIAGPMFFGAAKSAMAALHTIGETDHTYILSMRHVPTIDATGLVALESVLDRVFRSKIKIIFAGLRPEVAQILERAGIRREPGKIAYAPDIETAISMAIVHAARNNREIVKPAA